MNVQRLQQKLNARFGGEIRIADSRAFYHLTGQADTWNDAVEAGLLCAKKGGTKHVVSDITVDGLEKPKPILPKITDNAIDCQRPDVLIIGGGVVGCAIARELTKEKIEILLVEKEYDVALHASSRNDGMVHPGLDITPGLLKKKMNNDGNALYDQLCADLQVPFKRTGQYLGFSKHGYLALEAVSLPYWNLTAAGKAHLLAKKALHEAEPGFSPEIKSALYFDGTGIVCPYGLTIALAENAIDNGAKFSLDTAVLSMEVSECKIKSVTTNRGIVYPKIVINAAGVFSEDVAAMAKDRFFSIHPRKGTNSILDKKTKSLVNTIYSMMNAKSKTAHTKGGGIVSTVDGNVLLGPDAMETIEKENFATHKDSIEHTFDKHRQAGPWLATKDVITYFTGIRAATYEEDFIVEKGRATENLVHAAGIQSPGLTAAPAIALEIEKITIELLSKSMGIEKNPTFNPVRQAIPSPKELSAEERGKLIKSNSDFGQIVCRCEEITKGEILAAMNRSLPCETVDGIKRRVRAGMGRCQGGFCGQQVLQMISQEKGIPLALVRKGYPGSEILFGEKGGHNEKI